ncbi:hypothetical protein CEXT_50082 [Caerostris extrusa]|uniref:Uncharacterized protein n=1 Tax=Caerostris extrusa TaxID=172846 RepID=A0AAV4RRS0_CAEEX|nr:hypothetical protein CEXT_50082 [Caerostris extrusa]
MVLPCQTDTRYLISKTFSSFRSQKKSSMMCDASRNNNFIAMWNNQFHHLYMQLNRLTQWHQQASNSISYPWQNFTQNGSYYHNIQHNASHKYVRQHHSGNIYCENCNAASEVECSRQLYSYKMLHGNYNTTLSTGYSKQHRAYKKYHGNYNTTLNTGYSKQHHAYKKYHGNYNSAKNSKYLKQQYSYNISEKYNMAKNAEYSDEESDREENKSDDDSSDCESVSYFDVDAHRTVKVIHDVDSTSDNSKCESILHVDAIPVAIAVSDHDSFECESVSDFDGHDDSSDCESVSYLDVDAHSTVKVLQDVDSTLDYSKCESILDVDVIHFAIDDDNSDCESVSYLDVDAHSTVKGKVLQDVDSTLDYSKCESILDVDVIHFATAVSDRDSFECESVSDFDGHFATTVNDDNNSDYESVSYLDVDAHSTVKVLQDVDSTLDYSKCESILDVDVIHFATAVSDRDSFECESVSDFDGPSATTVNDDNNSDYESVSYLDVDAHSTVKGKVLQDVDSTLDYSKCESILDVDVIHFATAVSDRDSFECESVSDFDGPSATTVNDDDNSDCESVSYLDVDAHSTVKGKDDDNSDCESVSYLDVDAHSTVKVIHDVDSTSDNSKCESILHVAAIPVAIAVSDRDRFECESVSYFDGPFDTTVNEKLEVTDGSDDEDGGSCSSFELIDGVVEEKEIKEKDGYDG